MNCGIASSFTPQRGLRQGGPIYPYLFILGCEVLMRLINRKISNGNLRGVNVAGSTPPISKLCYANDVLLFCDARMDECTALTRYLEKYCNWSGQEISIENQEFFASKGVSHLFLNQVKCRWGNKKLTQNTKYLGVPLFLSNKKCKDLAPIIERLDSRLVSWKSKNLLWSRRATLIKSMAQAIPTYAMSTIQFLKSLCQNGCCDTQILVEA